MYLATSSRGLLSVVQKIGMQFNLVLSTVQKTHLFMTFMLISPKIQELWDWWFFRDYGPAGMLVASYLAPVNNISYFSGGIKNCLCVEAWEAPITKLFTYHSAVILYFYQINTHSAWTDQDLNHVKEIIRYFTVLNIIILKPYQPSQISNTNWLVLKHLVAVLCYKGSWE